MAFGSNFWGFRGAGPGNSVIAKSFSKHPKRAALLAVMGAFILISGLYLFGQRNLANLTLFLFLAGVNALQIERSRDSARYALDFRNWSLPLALIAMFIFGVFGNVRSALGGGAATPVVVYLNTQVEWLNSKAANGRCHIVVRWCPGKSAFGEAVRGLLRFGDPTFGGC